MKTKLLTTSLFFLCLIINAQTKLFYETKKKAEAGDAISQNKLGDYYYEGEEGIQIDLPKSVIWYKKSAKQGNSDAQFNLGYAYNYGKGVSENYSLAHEWFKKSAEQGDSDSQYYLCAMYLSNRIKDETSSTKAFYWAEKSAEQGNKKAQSILGSLYREGTGTPQDYNKALYWAKKSAEQGYDTAQVIVGEMYHLGETGTVDNGEAIIWYEKAAKQGDIVGQFYSAKLHNLLKRHKEAFYWFEKCYEQGENQCGEGLATMYFFGKGTTKNMSKAKSIFKQIGYVTCPSCGGSSKDKCIYCKGDGKRYSFSGSVLGNCNHCNGNGYDECGSCFGGLYNPN